MNCRLLQLSLGVGLLGTPGVRYDTIRYDTIRYFNVRSKADISQLNLPHEYHYELFNYDYRVRLK